MSGRHLLLALCMALAACNAPSERIVPALDAAPPEQAPPCVHEVCGDRPVRIRCYSATTYFCNEYAVDYERHCHCDAWGVVVKDGGQ